MVDASGIPRRITETTPAQKHNDLRRHVEQLTSRANPATKELRQKQAQNAATLEDLTKAQVQTHNTLQRLAFLLQDKGTITSAELSNVLGEPELIEITEPEPEESGEVFRAGYENERAADDSERSHTAHTESETLANKGNQSRASDTQTGAQ